MSITDLKEKCISLVCAHCNNWTSVGITLENLKQLAELLGSDEKIKVGCENCSKQFEMSAIGILARYKTEYQEHSFN